MSQQARAFTICLPFYRNAGMLREYCRRLRDWPDGLKAMAELIVVDDGSMILQENEKQLPGIARPARHEMIGMPFRLYRMNVNVRWNQDACRNLAVHEAKTEWVLLTDMDHIVPEQTARLLVEAELSPKMVYVFTRQTLEANHVLTNYKPHPNSWFMTREMYWAIGGYDERFAGLYGTDADFKERVWAKVGEPVRLDAPLIRVPRETIPDASTTTYERKQTQDGQLKDLRRRRNATPGWKPMHLTFPWERLA